MNIRIFSWAKSSPREVFNHVVERTMCELKEGSADNNVIN